MFPKLFEPIRIGPVSVPNRIAMAPMVTQYADRGAVSEQQLAYYAARARGGVGLIITEAVFTSPSAADECPVNVLALSDTRHVLGLTELVETIHAFGAKVFVQLNIGLGVQGSSQRSGKPPVGPSPVAYRVPLPMVPRNVLVPGFLPYLTGETPREMTVEEIEREQDAFVRSAILARAAGFDGLEIHAGNGFLLHDFLSPRFNHRTDRYGGSLENRMRFLLELVRRVHAAVGADMAVGVRTSVDERTSGGTTRADTTVIVRRLEDEGAHYFHVSEGCFESLKYTIPDEGGTMLESAAAVKKACGLPIVTPSIHDPAEASRAVETGVTDMIALGRQLIADPDWATKVRWGRLHDIRTCDRCNRGCFARLFEGKRVQCVRNPESGLERYNPAYTRLAALQQRIARRTERRRGSRVHQLHA